MCPEEAASHLGLRAERGGETEKMIASGLGELGLRCPWKASKLVLELKRPSRGLNVAVDLRKES